MEPFKNVFHRSGIELMGKVFAEKNPTFPRKRFVSLASENLESLELKQRSTQIYTALVECLPPSFPQAAAWIESVLHPSCDGNPAGEGTTEDGVQGWLVMPLAEYAGLHGKDDLESAMALMRQLTMRFTSEFGIRHLIMAHPQPCLAIMKRWCDDENHHVRRLASEGSRPRLPWGMQLPHLLAQPQLTLPILEKLRDDPSEYVRRSVANHLNDHAKSHAPWVLDVAEKWNRKAPAPRKKLLRHALRNLLKQGQPQALRMFGMQPPAIDESALTLLTPQVPFHGDLRFELAMKSTSAESQKIRLDVIIHYQKANGTLAPKTYLWKEIILPGYAEHRAERKQSFRPISTRVYHRGRHRLEVRANGACLGEHEFELV